MNIKTKPHTIFLLVGPSGCGKTTFASSLETRLGVGVYSAGVRCQLIRRLESDAIRQGLLGVDADKYQPEMLAVSEQAFRILFEKLDCLTSYPVNTEFVIVDTTGLSKPFRERVQETAKRNHYRIEAVLFDFKERQEYFKYLDDPDSLNGGARTVISNQIKRFKEETMPELGKRDYDAVYRMKTKDEEFTVEVEGCNLLVRTRLRDDLDTLVIGDVHGCWKELLSLLDKAGIIVDDAGEISYPKKQIVFVGDVIDKGPDSAGVIEFLYQNREKIHLVLGNHENYVAKHFSGKLDKPAPEETVKTYFTSIAEFAEGSDVQRKLIELVALSKPFVRTNRLIVTHSPCEKKYLAKTDAESLRRQRSFYYPKHEEHKTDEEWIAATEKALDFLKTESAQNLPYHVFGHIATERGIRLKNKIGIDTGCVEGGKLTALEVRNDGELRWYSVPSGQAKGKPLLDLFRERKAVTFADLDYEDKQRALRLADDKINFVSGTMSPSDKDPERGLLESIETALSYYAGHGIEWVVLQPKYMGSRANVELYRDIERCRTITRNGFVIKKLDLKSVYQKLHKRLLGWMIEMNYEMVLLDGELMPWSALGEGLVEHIYKAADAAIGSELRLLQEAGFEAAFTELECRVKSSGFLEERNVLKKDDLIKKYGHHTYTTYRLAGQARIPIVAQLQEYHEIFHRQVELYGTKGDVDFKPFAVIKRGTERADLEDNYSMFRLLSDDRVCLVRTDEPDEANLFYREIVSEGYEGVVVKPRIPRKGVAPYLKVRNPDYLSLIYGYDYRIPEYFNRQMERKSIKKKLRISIEEWETGMEMLKISQKDISRQNQKYLDLAARMVADLKKEEGLDPRL